MKRRICSSILAAVLLAALTACGTNAPDVQDGSGNGEIKIPEKISLYTYYADASIPTIDKTLEQLKELYPGLTIEVEHRTDSDGSVLKTRASVGELPDIFECTGQLTDIFVQSGDIAPLNDTIQATGFFDNFIEQSFNGKQHQDGNYYALNISNPEPCLMFYNKQVLEKLNLSAPTNYPELLQTVKELAAADIIPLSLFAQQKWPGLQMYDMAIIGQGEVLGLGGLEDGSRKITDEAYVKAAEKLHELVEAGMIGKGALNTNASQAFELLRMGQAAFLVNGSWYFTDAKEYGENIGYLQFNPFADPGTEDDVRWSVSGGAPEVGGYAVNAKGQYAEFCKTLVLDLIEQRGKVSVVEFGAVSRFKEQLEPKEARYEAYQVFSENIGNIQTTTNYEWALADQELIVTLEDTTEKLLTGSYSAEDFISDLEKQIAFIIKE